jgi:hypothetical protein
VTKAICISISNSTLSVVVLEAIMDEEEVATRKHTARGRRILQKREPQVIEDNKKVLIMKAQHTSEVVQDVLKDIARMTKPNCVTFSKKNVVYPFEDINPIEFLTEKNDCSLVAVGSHTKKRPNNLVLVSRILSRTRNSFICYLNRAGRTTAIYWI